jgi:site-specific recombinase XerD
MKIKPLLWKYNTLKDGTHPIKIRISDIINGKKSQRYFNLDFYVTPQQWDNKNAMVKYNHPLAAEINIKISTKMRDLQKQYLETDKIDFKKTNSIISYYENMLPELKIRCSAVFYNKMESILKKLKRFNSNLEFDNFKLTDIRDFEMHLFKIGNSRNTVLDNLHRLKYIINNAVKDGILPYDKNPFLNYKFIWPAHKKERIEYSEIKKIEALNLKVNSSIWHTRNYWLFSFYCAGIRFGDLCRLSQDNIVKIKGLTKLVYTMNKTNKHRNILLTENALNILKLYSENHDLIFNIITHIPKDKFVELRLIASQNALSNKNLKTIAKLAGISTWLTFHSSRHSFADYAKQNDLDIHTIKELLGHSKVTTTEIYMKSFYQEETDNAMNKLFTKKKVISKKVNKT